LIDSTCEKAAVDDERMASDKARGIRCKKHRRSYQFFDLPKAAHGGANQEFLAALGGIQKWGVEVGAKNSRSDGVYARLSHLFSKHSSDRRRPAGEALWRRGAGRRDQQPARYHRRLEELLFLQHEPQGLGREVHGGHPNLVALEISSFKCGHDAPIYGVVEGIIEQSGTPYFCFKDLDENKPSCSIRIRVETIDYFLRRYREEVIRKRKAEQDIEAQLAALEAPKHLGWRSCAQVAMPAV
jgi:hypothetical protein